MVYVGDKKIGTFPDAVEKSKVYSFPCDTAGNFVKIVTGRDDKKLTFSNVKVYGIFNKTMTICVDKSPKESMSKKFMLGSWRFFDNAQNLTIGV